MSSSSISSSSSSPYMESKAMPSDSFFFDAIIRLNFGCWCKLVQYRFEYAGEFWILMGDF
ncbi:hypothetical protein Hanom_Chr11g01055831 [Helianthus anomalus]